MFKFFKIRIKRIFTALKGMYLLLITEASIQVQFVFILFFVFAGFFFEISLNEWIIQIFLSGFILSTESLNTSIEKLCDFINPEYSKKIGLIKDFGAGAVSFAVFPSLIILFFIYCPYIFV